MSVRDHIRGRSKVRRRTPDFVRKAGPHKDRTERRNSKRDALRRAMLES